MDRADSWLSRQAGWRAAALLWLSLWPPVAMMGFAAWNMFGPGSGLPAAAVAIVVPCAVAACLPFAVAAVVIRRIRPGRPAARPEFSSRFGVGMVLCLGGMLLDLASDGAGWPHGRQLAAGAVALGLTGGGCVFLVAAALRYRRAAVSQRAGARPADQTGS